MSQIIKNKIYSDIEDKFINVMDVEKIILELTDDVDVGYFKVIAFCSDNGKAYRAFPGKVDEDWTENGLYNLAEIRNQEAERCGKLERFSAIPIGYIHVRSSKNNEDEMWRELWRLAEKKVNAFCKDIKKAQEWISWNKFSSSINLKNF